MNKLSTNKLTEREIIDLFHSTYFAKAMTDDSSRYRKTGKSIYWDILQNSGFSKDQFLSVLLDPCRTYAEDADECFEKIRELDLLERYEKWSVPAFLSLYVGNRIQDELDFLFPGIDKRAVKKQSESRSYSMERSKIWAGYKMYYLI